MTSVRSIMIRFIAAYLVVCIAGTMSAQQAPVLSKSAETIRRKVQKLVPHAPITVVLFHGKEAFGNFLANGTDSFTFHDVDRDTDVTVQYEDVRKLKNGYGGYGLNGRHTDRTRNLIFAGVVLGVLGGLIAAAASASN